jgi:hypothetical protein
MFMAKLTADPKLRQYLKPPLNFDIITKCIKSLVALQLYLNKYISQLPIKSELSLE